MMEHTLQEKYEYIRHAVSQLCSPDPIMIAEAVMHKDFVSMHGPEHHFLDGAAFLVAYRNAGGALDLDRTLAELAKRTAIMPGAMCGYWGICGSVASVGAALSVLHGTGPLSTDNYYRDHMAYTSEVIRQMSTIGGARCCKRNAFLSLMYAAQFVREHYGIPMACERPVCTFSPQNRQCLGVRCPFYPRSDT